MFRVNQLNYISVITNSCLVHIAAVEDLEGEPMEKIQLKLFKTSKILTELGGKKGKKEKNKFRVCYFFYFYCKIQKLCGIQKINIVKPFSWNVSSS